MPICLEGNYYTVEEAREAAGYDRHDMIMMYIHNGELPATRIGKRVFVIEGQDLSRFLAKKTERDDRIRRNKEHKEMLANRDPQQLLFPKRYRDIPQEQRSYIINYVASRPKPPERNMGMLKERLIDGKTYQEIGDMHGITSTRANQLAQHALRRVIRQSGLELAKCG